METKESKSVVDKVEIASLDASALNERIGTFDIYVYAKEYMEEHGFTDKSKYDFEIDVNRDLIHIYALQ